MDDSKRYVDKVQEGVQRYVRDVLDENNRLRVLLAELTAENETLSSQVQQHRQQQERLHQQLTEVESATERFAAQYLQIEQQNANLANLYVASYQLASTVERDMVLQSIQEIVANLIGSEEVGIYERNGDTLTLAASIGIDAIRLARIPIGKGRIGAVAESGEMYVSPSGTPDHEHITACIPLRVEGEVTGLIAIFGLLGHKPALADVDRELFDLLAVHAATSLYCASLHSMQVVEVG